TADSWNYSIESWLYITGTDVAKRLGIEGYYLRTVPPELDGRSTPKQGHVTLRSDPPGREGVPVSEVVSVDALCLVRFGLRRADDPRILNTLKAIDATLRVETPRGPSWRRYVGDGYGEHADGSPYLKRNGTIGRAWPLLTGERGHYELMAGRRAEAERLARAMADQAGDGGMIPEQVWDADDIPEKGLFKGRPTDSAAPLIWAHAEYVKLLRSLRDGAVFDLPPQTACRYLERGVTTDRVIWRLDHPREVIAEGEVLRVVLDAPAKVRWTVDRWANTCEVDTRDSTVGTYYADLDTKNLPAGMVVRMKFHWADAHEFEGKTFKVDVV
ncbi:MAG TPA: glycoside hydrolase family 15 protein, partial [Isosphaeraceae bacterium]|nr:glycoside hydrolase family 15 protein [Isosphaeraceae bacterium]